MKINREILYVAKQKKIRLTKINDSINNKYHTSNIFEKKSYIGYEVLPMVVGACYQTSCLVTSPVIQLLDSNGIFKTKDSTYKLEYLE